MGLYELVARLEQLDALDGVARTVTKSVAKVVPHGPVKDLLSGTWLGHTLHPMLSDVPIGAWFSASALDLFGGEDAQKAADLLVKWGLLASVPTAAAGLTDLSDTMGAQRRVGLVHASTNSAATILYLGSVVARGRGRRRLGVTLGLAGSAVTMVSAYLGGHLSLAQGLGVDHTAFEARPEDWTTALAADELPEGQPTKAEVDGSEVLLVRSGGTIRALSDRCSHLGGPLSEGQLTDGCVVCPWHGSTFRLADGSVAAGPARSPQPAYDVRVSDGNVQVRSRGPAH